MVMTPRVQGLNVGVTDIHRWRQQDEVHLPESRFRPAPFLPQPQALDAILRRETLDERLARHVVPSTVDPDLLAPAAELLADEVALDDDVQRALAALLRG